MTQVPFHTRPALLHRDRHRRTRIRAVPGWDFARQANSVHLAAVEFAEACKDYAIVFTRTAGGALAPVVVLGLRAGENLHVDTQGRWSGRYIPAFVRRYPFVLAELPGNQWAVCIDEACAGVNETEGEPLFDAAGQPSATLQGALDFLQNYQREHVRTQAFCERLEASGLLQAMTARADLTDGRSFQLDGLLVVDESRLMQMPDESVLTMFRAGDLHLISMHLLSLSNLRRLVDAMPPLAATPDAAGAAEQAMPVEGGDAPA